MTFLQMLRCSHIVHVLYANIYYDKRFRNKKKLYWIIE